MLTLKNFSVEQHKRNWSELENTIDIYKKVGHRNIYLFDWLLFMWENLYFSCVSQNYINKLAILKTKVAILDTLWDDLADSASESQNDVLYELEKIVHHRDLIDKSKLTKENSEYLEAILKIYDDIMVDVSKLPRYAEFRKILDWDFKQLDNSMQYAHMINVFPEVDNIIENRVYGHHSMTVIICGMIDLMASLRFNRGELYNVRKILYLAQQMARIGNMINTYPREAIENDISSEVATVALEKKLIKQKTETGKKLKVLSKLITDFDKIWADYYKEIESIGKEVKSINIKEFLRERKYIQDMYKKRVQYWNKNFANKFFVDRI
tara:strand:- start:5314 stop:6285 length:972 start_codon:yes stop_codon:yes gene_type:complete